MIQGLQRRIISHVALLAFFNLLMATIDMRNAKTENTIGLQEHTSMYVGAEIGMYKGEMRQMYLKREEYKWGKISSDYDARSNISSINIVYI